MNINIQDDVERLNAIWQTSLEEMRRYEEFYAGSETQLASNVYYQNSKARATACSNRIMELSRQSAVNSAYN